MYGKRGLAGKRWGKKPILGPFSVPFLKPFLPGLAPRTTGKQTGIVWYIHSPSCLGSVLAQGSSHCVVAKKMSRLCVHIRTRVIIRIAFGGRGCRTVQ